MESNKAALIGSENPFLELLSFVFVWLGCALLGSLVLSSFMQANGWTDFTSILSELRTNNDGDVVNQLRYLQIIGHLSNYFLPSLIYMGWWHRRRAWKMLQLDQVPKAQNLLAAFAAVVVLFPFVSWLYYWNTQVLPEEWIGQDKLELQATFMNMRNRYELLLNILLLGVIAALGEELVFRGIIQRILQNWSKNVHFSAIATAALFSFIHFQWEGFAARFVMGLLFCYLLVYTRNLWVPILMHFFFNTIQVIIPYFYPNLVEEIGTVKEVPVLVAVVSISLFTIIWRSFILNKIIIIKTK